MKAGKKFLSIITLTAIVASIATSAIAAEKPPQSNTSTLVMGVVGAGAEIGAGGLGFVTGVLTAPASVLFAKGAGDLIIAVNNVIRAYRGQEIGSSNLIGEISIAGGSALGVDKKRAQQIGDLTDLAVTATLGVGAVTSMSKIAYATAGHHAFTSASSLFVIGTEGVNDAIRAAAAK